MVSENNMRITVKRRQRFFRIAPQQPKKATRKTMQPTAMINTGIDIDHPYLLSRSSFTIAPYWIYKLHTKCFTFVPLCECDVSHVDHGTKHCYQNSNNLNQRKIKSWLHMETRKPVESVPPSKSDKPTNRPAAKQPTNRNMQTKRQAKN